MKTKKSINKTKGVTQSIGMQIDVRATVIEEKSDYYRSRSKGKLFAFKELPKVFRQLIKDLEKTKFYKDKGYVWFYLDTVGTKSSGTFKFNPEGKTIQEMFKSVTQKDYSKLPPNERTFFFKGDWPMTVFLMRVPGMGYRRVVVEGVSHQNVHGVAPIVVIKKVKTRVP